MGKLKLLTNKRQTDIKGRLKRLTEPEFSTDCTNEAPRIPVTCQEDFTNASFLARCTLIADNAALGEVDSYTRALYYRNIRENSPNQDLQDESLASDSLFTAVVMQIEHADNYRPHYLRWDLVDWALDVAHELLKDTDFKALLFDEGVSFKQCLENLLDYQVPGQLTSLKLIRIFLDMPLVVIYPQTVDWYLLLPVRGNPDSDPCYAQFMCEDDFDLDDGLIQLVLVSNGFLHFTRTEPFAASKEPTLKGKKTKGHKKTTDEGASSSKSATAKTATLPHKKASTKTPTLQQKGTLPQKKKAKSQTVDDVDDVEHVEPSKVVKATARKGSWMAPVITPVQLPERETLSGSKFQSELSGVMTSLNRATKKALNLSLNYNTGIRHRCAVRLLSRLQNAKSELFLARQADYRKLYSEKMPLIGDRGETTNLDIGLDSESDSDPDVPKPKKRKVVLGKVYGQLWKYKCPCGEVFQKSSDLAGHRQVVHEGNPFECAKCKKVFSHKRSLDSHLDTHKDKKKFVCEDCDFSHVDWRGLLAHGIKEHNKEKPAKYNCPKCDKYMGPKHLAKHVKGCGDESRKFACFVCHLKFKDQDYFREHCKTCQDPSMRPTCPYCGATYANKSSLGAHLKWHLAHK